MSLRATAVWTLAAITLLGCNRTETPPSGEPVRSARAPAASVAPASPAPSASGPAAPTPIAALKEPLRLVDSDPKAAIGAFKKIEGAYLPDAYLGYLLLRTGDAAGSKTYLERAKETMPTAPLVDDNRSAMYEALRVLRVAIEESDRTGEPPIACGVFAEHGKDALDAFGGMWGSTRDNYGRQMKNYCVGRILASAAPAKADAVVKAQTELFDALTALAPMPDGTMYYAMYVGSTNIVRDALLAPEQTVAPASKTLDAAVAKAAKKDPGIRGRLAAFKTVRTRVAPVLGDAVCDVLKARSRPADPKACGTLADQAVNSAAVSWVQSSQPD